MPSDSTRAWTVVAIFDLTNGDLCWRRAVCPSVLLRVPRARTALAVHGLLLQSERIRHSGCESSSLTSAEHPGRPLFGLFQSVYWRKKPCLATGMACLPKRSQGGGRRTGDMSVGRYAVVVAGSDAHLQPRYYAVLSSAFPQAKPLAQAH